MYGLYGGYDTRGLESSDVDNVTITDQKDVSLSQIAFGAEAVRAVPFEEAARRRGEVCVHFRHALQAHAQVAKLARAGDERGVHIEIARHF